jgi:hypothetical protein
MSRLQWVILIAGLVLSVVFIVVGVRSPTTGEETASRLRGTDNQAHADLADIQPEFDRLVQNANDQIDALLRRSVQRQSTSNWLSWLAIAVTAAITLLAAFAGVSPSAAPQGNGPRSTIVIIIAVLAATSSIVQTVNERFQKIAIEDRKTATMLYDKANVARRAFIDAGPNHLAAEIAKDDLFHVLTEAGYEPRK